MSTNPKGRRTDEWSREQRTLFWMLVRKKARPNEIAQRLGKSRSAIMGFAFRHGHYFGLGFIPQYSRRPRPVSVPRRILGGKVKPPKLPKECGCCWVEDLSPVTYCDQQAIDGAWCATHRKRVFKHALDVDPAAT